MIRIGLMCAVLICFAACRSPSPTDVVSASAFVYPGSRFTAEGRERILDQITAMGITTNDMRELFAAGQSAADLERSLTDPFVSELLCFVRFESFDSARRITAYYEPLFRSAGWREVRSIYPIEHSNCGGDWLRVYRRGSWQVLLHVCGSWEKLPDETEQMLVARTITFRFLGLHPDELLGGTFRTTAFKASTNSIEPTRAPEGARGSP